MFVDKENYNFCNRQEYFVKLFSYPTKEMYKNKMCRIIAYRINNSNLKKKHKLHLDIL